MLFRPFYGVMYGFVIRIACVACIYMRAYIIISTCVRAKEMAAFKARSCVSGVHFCCCCVVQLLLLFLLFFFLASNSCLCSIKWACFCIVFTPILCSKRGEFTIFCRCNSNLIEMQKQCNFSLKRQKMNRFSHKSIKK